jgi:predicted RNase H-like HicB family nuclease
MTTRYAVSLKKVDDGYSVWVPGLPGCWSQGATQKEALENIKEAISEYLSVASELGKEKDGIRKYVDVSMVHA